MKSRLANIFMGAALVFATGLIGWQTWTGNQMKTQLSQLQSQLQSIASQQMAGSILAAQCPAHRNRVLLPNR